MTGIEVVPLLLVAVIVVESAALHEFGHVLTAKALGGSYNGIVWRWYGVGVKIDAPAGTLWIVALGGLSMTAFLALAFLAWDSPYSAFGFTLNALILLTNLIPHPRLDGGHILAHFKG